MTTYSSREEIDEQYRWDLSSIFESDEAFLAALEEAKETSSPVRIIPREDQRFGSRAACLSKARR